MKHIPICGQQLLLTLILLFHPTGCKKSLPEPPAASPKPELASPALPSKSLVRAPHFRFYFEIRNCNWSDVHYLGYENVNSFVQTNPDTLHPDFRSKYLVVNFIGEQENALYQTYIQNPQYVLYPWAKGDNRNYFIEDCHFKFFVDAGDTLPLDGVRAISFSPIILETGEEAHFKLSFISSDIHQKLADAGNLFREDFPVDISKTPVRQLRLSGNADPRTAWDVVFLVDGATEKEMDISSDQALRNSPIGEKIGSLIGGIISVAPFNTLTQQINFWLVATPSAQAGTDIPYKNIAVSTFFESSLGTECIRRSITIDNSLAMLQLANLVPFDEIIMLVNTQEYGGTWSGAIFSTFQPDYIETVIHEIAHSVGRLNDQYFYFSDFENVRDCTDNQIEQRVLRKQLPRSMENEDSFLAANETLFPTLSEAKWRDLLTPQSPRIEIAYPLSPPKIDEKNHGLKYRFKKHFAGEKLFLLSGLVPETNRDIFNFDQLLVENKSVHPSFFRVPSPKPFFPGLGGLRSFQFVVVDESLDADNLSIELHYSDDTSWENALQHQHDANSLVLVSQIFNPQEIGLFQGSHSDLFAVWRSSYVSNMGGPFQFDAVESRAIANGIRAFQGSVP